LARISEVQQQINAQRESNPTAAYQERLAQIRGMGVGGSGAGQGGSSGAPQLLQTSANAAGGNTFGQFAGTGRATAGSWIPSPKRRARRLSCAPASSCRPR
jgi:hypothetical protein